MQCQTLTNSFPISFFTHGSRGRLKVSTGFARKVSIRLLLTEKERAHFWCKSRLTHKGTKSLNFCVLVPWWLVHSGACKNVGSAYTKLLILIEFSPISCLQNVLKK